MIAEISDIKIRLRFSFVAAVTLMLYFCEEKTVLCAFFASLIHESGHLFFIMLFKARLNSIELGAFGICIERRESSILSYKKESLIALGGIIFNLTTCFLFCAAYCIFKSKLLITFAAVNLLVASFNSLPSIYLDMGRALNYLLLSYTEEEKALTVTTSFSYATAIILSVFFIIYSAAAGFNVSLLAVTLYLNLITFKRKVEK